VLSLVIGAISVLALRANLLTRLDDQVRIIALQAGRIMADGTPRDVVSESNLARIFGTDVTVILQGNRPFVVV